MAFFSILELKLAEHFGSTFISQASIWSSFSVKTSLGHENPE
jgi:hypothetical protein